MFKTLTFILLSSLYLTSQSELLIKHSSNLKEYRLESGKKIKYQLHSDSLLGYMDNWEKDMIQSFTDSSIVFPSGEELVLSDLKKISFHSTFIEHWRNASIPILILGSPSFLYGITKGGFEGLERDNAEQVPLYTLSGSVMLVFGIFPYCIKPKELSRQKGYEFYVQ